MLRIITLSLGLLAFGVACDATSTPECVDNGGCADGQACIADRCEEVECLASSDCSIHNFCDKEYSCRQGCKTSEDCLAGEACSDDNRCHAEACRNSTLDCEIGQICSDSGECRTDTYDNCKVCDPYDEIFGGEPCGSNGSCFTFEEGSTMGQCLKTCSASAADPCPAGFTCQDVTGAGEYYCAAWCPMLEENGWL